MPGDAFEQTRVMACSHREFRYSLTKFRPDLDWSEPRTNHFVALDPPRTVEITLGPEETRRIGMLALPQTAVTLRLEGYAEPEREAFLRRFDIAFQRGGG